MQTPRLFLVAVAIHFFGLPILAGDWPEFRGPGTQGLYDGKPLPLHWGPDQNITWRASINGLGWSSPAIVADRVYLTTAVPSGNDLSLRAICLGTANGKIEWDQEVFVQESATAPRVHNKNSHASPSPIVRNGKMFVHFGHQGTACLDLHGKILWRNRDLKYAPVHGNGGSPLLLDNRLIFSCDGRDDPFVVALSAETGKVLWKTPRSCEFQKRFSFSTPCLIEADGMKQVVVPGSGGVGAYDPATGAEIWKVVYDGYSVVPRPVFGHGMVFLSTGYDSPTLLAIRVNGTGDVTDTHVAWRLKRGAPHNPSPLLVGDEVYLVSDQGQASCVDAKTGKVHWQERIQGAYSSSPMFANGHVYFLNETGTTTVVKAEKKFYEVARNSMKERTLASFAAANGSLYLRTDKALYRIDERK